MFYNTDNNVRKIEVGSELNQLGAEQNCVTNTQTNGNEEVNQEAQPNGRSNCFWFGIFVTTTFILTLIPIVTFLIVYYTRKDDGNDGNHSNVIADNGTVCGSKNFDFLIKSNIKWLYSLSDSIVFKPWLNQCSSNITCANKVITENIDSYKICSNLYYFPSTFSNYLYGFDCNNIHVAFDDQPVCKNSTIGYITKEDNLFICSDFNSHISSENTSKYTNIDLINLFFNKYVYVSNTSESKIISSGSSIGTCSDFVGDVTVKVDQSAILCMTELYLACN